MTGMEPIETNCQPLEDSFQYDLSGPLWEQYFQRTRKSVRFPRNYKEVSALDSDLRITEP